MAKPKKPSKLAADEQFDYRGVSPSDPRAPYTVREDGTTKGQGFFGPVRHASGHDATELSVSDGPQTSRAYTDKNDMLYPSMVPTLTQDELNTVLGGGDRFPESVYDKAEAYARGRLAAGKSPFAGPGEQYPAPGYEDQFQRAYPNAVLSYPDRTVGYEYDGVVDRYRGAPMTSGRKGGR